MRIRLLKLKWILAAASVFARAGKEVWGVRILGFGGLGFGVWGLGFRVWDVWLGM